MKYSVEKGDNHAVLIPHEEKLDSLKAPVLKTEFLTLLQTGPQNMVLDLSEVKYVDSSGLSAILVANRAANEADGTLVLVGVAEHVMKLIRIAKLDQVLNILPTRQEGVEFIFLNEIEKGLSAEGEEE